MIADRLVELLPAINRRAAFVGSHTLTADDVAQEMALSILERAAKNPNLENQKNAYILYDAYMNGGLHSARHERLCHEKHLADAVLACDSSNDNDEPEFNVFVPADSDVTPEDALIHSEAIEITMSKLSPSNRKLVAMLYIGYSETEIAKALHISRPAVSQRKRVIANVLAAAMF